MKTLPAESEIERDDTEAWNAGRAVSRLGGDKSLLQKLATLFIEEAPKLMAEIARGIQQEDYQAAFIPTHSLKGSSGNFCPRAFELICKAILKQLEQENWRQAEVELENLILEYTSLENSFRDFIES
jgi:HPt (histidine-containing phosphotransfer) domain-containing protein